MIVRVARLVRAEILKLVSHRFMAGALGALTVCVVLGETLGPRLAGLKESEWASFHAIQLFSYGFKFGIQVATYVLVVFSSMILAGEFDRGTIKNLLTRPITRTDLFAAKGVTVAAVGTFLYVFVFYLSLALALARGDMGDVWDDTGYRIQVEYGRLTAIAWKAVLMSFVPFLTAGFMGLLVSSATQSSGHAVAFGTLALAFGDILLGHIFGPSLREVGEKIFLYYVPTLLEKLKQLAGGFNERWEEDIENRMLYLKVPLAYAAVFLAAAYSIFRSRNIHA